MARNLPIIFGILLIVGLTGFEIQMTDRLSGTKVSAEQRAELLGKVPINIGDWHGEEKDIDPNVRQKAGAIGAVSRTYRNSRTGEMVDLWLIVGHARDVAFHTPDICYPASGFEARASENSLYPMVFAGEPAGIPFLTNTFLKEDATGQHLVRVFWSWYNSEDKSSEGKVVWDAPHNARWHFGNTRALYKMYFTSMMRKPDEPADQSACVRFARDFLPEVNKALAEVYSGAPSTEGKDTVTTSTALEKVPERTFGATKTDAIEMAKTEAPNPGKTSESPDKNKLFPIQPIAPPTIPSKSGP